MLAAPDAALRSPTLPSLPYAPLRRPATHLTTDPLYLTPTPTSEYAKDLFNLGTVFYEGVGVEVDVLRAANRWQKSADLGYKPAQAQLDLHAKEIEKAEYALRAARVPFEDGYKESTPEGATVDPSSFGGFFSLFTSSKLVEDPAEAELRRQQEEVALSEDEGEAEDDEASAAVLAAEAAAAEAAAAEEKARLEAEEAHAAAEAQAAAVDEAKAAKAAADAEAGFTEDEKPPAEEGGFLGFLFGSTPKDEETKEEVDAAEEKAEEPPAPAAQDVTASAAPMASPGEMPPAAAEVQQAVAEVPTVAEPVPIGAEAHAAAADGSDLPPDYDEKTKDAAKAPVDVDGGAPGVFLGGAPAAAEEGGAPAAAEEGGAPTTAAEMSDGNWFALATASAVATADAAEATGAEGGRSSGSRRWSLPKLFGSKKAAEESPAFVFEEEVGGAPSDGITDADLDEEEEDADEPEPVIEQVDGGAPGDGISDADLDQPQPTVMSWLGLDTQAKLNKAATERRFWENAVVGGAASEAVTDLHEDTLMKGYVKSKDHDSGAEEPGAAEEPSQVASSTKPAVILAISNKEYSRRLASDHTAWTEEEKQEILHNEEVQAALKAKNLAVAKKARIQKENELMDGGSGEALVDVNNLPVELRIREPITEADRAAARKMMFPKTRPFQQFGMWEWAGYSAKLPPRARLGSRVFVTIEPAEPASFYDGMEADQVRVYDDINVGRVKELIREKMDKCGRPIVGALHITRVGKNLNDEQEFQTYGGIKLEYMDDNGVIGSFMTVSNITGQKLKRRKWRFASLDKNMKWRMIETAPQHAKDKFANDLKKDSTERQNKTDWRRMCADFLEFSAEKGGEDGPMDLATEATHYTKLPEDKALKKWADEMRKRKREGESGDGHGHGGIREGRMRRLQSIGFVWTKQDFVYIKMPNNDRQKCPVEWDGNKTRKTGLDVKKWIAEKNPQYDVETMSLLFPFKTTMFKRVQPEWELSNIKETGELDVDTEVDDEDTLSDQFPIQRGSTIYLRGPLHLVFAEVERYEVPEAGATLPGWAEALQEEEPELFEKLTKQTVEVEDGMSIVNGLMEFGWITTREHLKKVEELGGRNPEGLMLWVLMNFHDVPTYTVELDNDDETTLEDVLECQLTFLDPSQKGMFAEGDKVEIYSEDDERMMDAKITAVNEGTHLVLRALALELDVIRHHLPALPDLLANPYDDFNRKYDPLNFVRARLSHVESLLWQLHCADELLTMTELDKVYECLFIIENMQAVSQGDELEKWRGVLRSAFNKQLGVIQAMHKNSCTMGIPRFECRFDNLSINKIGMPKLTTFRAFELELDELEDELEDNVFTRAEKTLQSIWDLSKPEYMKTKAYKQNVVEIFPPGHDGKAAAIEAEGEEETKGEEGDEGAVVFSSAGSVAMAEAAEKAKEEKAEAKRKAEQPRAEVWYQKEGSAVAAEKLWSDGCTFEMNYVTPWAVGYVDPLTNDEVIMLDRHSVVPSHNVVEVSTKNEQLSIKVFVKFWNEEGAHLSEAKPLGRINIEGLIPADVLKARAKHARRKVKVNKTKEGKKADNFEQTCLLKFKLSVRGFLEVDLNCDPMSAKSAIKLVPRPKIPELRPGNWCVFMGKPFIVEAVHPPPVGTFDDDARIEVKVRTLEEGLPHGWEGSLMLDYGEREVDIPFDQVKHLQHSSKGMSEEEKKEMEAVKKRQVDVKDVVQVATNVYDVAANPDYKQFRYDVLGDEVDLTYVDVDKKFVETQLKDWQAQVADSLKNRDNKEAAAEEEEEEEEDPKFLGLNPDWLTRRHVNAAEKFHIDVSLEGDGATFHAAPARTTTTTTTTIPHPPAHPTPMRCNHPTGGEQGGGERGAAENGQRNEEQVGGRCRDRDDRQGRRRRLLVGADSEGRAHKPDGGGHRRAARSCQAHDGAGDTPGRVPLRGGFGTRGRCAHDPRGAQRMSDVYVVRRLAGPGACCGACYCFQRAA